MCDEWSVVDMSGIDVASSPCPRCGEPIDVIGPDRFSFEWGPQAEFTLTKLEPFGTLCCSTCVVAAAPPEKQPELIQRFSAYGDIRRKTGLDAINATMYVIEGRAPEGFSGCLYVFPIKQRPARFLLPIIVLGSPMDTQYLAVPVFHLTLPNIDAILEIRWSSPWTDGRFTCEILGAWNLTTEKRLESLVSGLRLVHEFTARHGGRPADDRDTRRNDFLSRLNAALEQARSVRASEGLTWVRQEDVAALLAMSVDTLGRRLKEVDLSWSDLRQPSSEPL